MELIDKNTTVSNIIDLVKKINRPNWNEYFMMVAYLISQRSSCDRLHVGCVIVQNNRIISTGYNGHIKGADHTSKIVDGHEQMTIHAETNAITDAAARGVKVQDSTAYVTHFPCINCTKVLITAGITHIIYAEDYHNNEICFELYKMGKVSICQFKQK